MKLRKPVVNYLKLRPRNITSPEYRHVFLLLYWVVYMIAWFLIEQLTPASRLTLIHSPLDDMIPFWEWSFLAYAGWYLSLVWVTLYTLAYDLDAFKRFMHYLILTTAIAMVVFVVWPCEFTRADLDSLGRDNIMLDLTRLIYTVDMNRNVCPSLHCTGAFAVLFAARSTASFRTPGWTVFFTVFALLVCASTVLIKQHSILDFFAALPLISIGYYVVYFRHRKEIDEKCRKDLASRAN